jgi:hypothetical protein
MTGTAVLHDDAEQWLAREVAVAAFLAERTDLVVPPSDILPPGPHEQDRLWMTLWKFVPHDAQASPPEPTGTRPRSYSLPTVIRALKTWRRSSRRTLCMRLSGRRSRADADRGP